MRPTLALTAMLLLTPIAATAAEPCQTFRGRAHLYGGAGQLRIWHIGTHHEFKPDETTDATVLGWLDAGVPDAEKRNYASPASSVMLFGDFTVCPIEPWLKGSVQRAKVLSVIHKHYVRLD